MPAAPYRISREDRRRFSSYLWESPREMMAGAILGGAMFCLLFSFWLAFARLHVYGFWQFMIHDLILIDAMALALSAMGSFMVGRHPHGLGIYWCLCAALAAAFSVASGLFGLPALPGAQRFFVVYHVLPALPYALVGGALLMAARSRAGRWWLVAFPPAALAAPLAAALSRPPGQDIEWGLWAALGTWALALGSWIPLARRPQTRGMERL